MDNHPQGGERVLGGSSSTEQQPVFPAPQEVPQLPPQMFTTAAQLLDLTDKKVVLVLRDGRSIIGVLRSWDQFANLVLQDTVERYFVQNKYWADIPRALNIIRGENVLILGEIDLDKEDNMPPGYEERPMQFVHALWKEEQAAKKKADKRKSKKLQAYGFGGESGQDTIQ